VKRDKVKEDIDRDTNKLWEEYEITPNNASDFKKPDNVNVASKLVNELRGKIRDLGSVNVDSIDEYKELSKRYDFMCEQRLDIENTMAKLRDVIGEMIDTMKEQFIKQFNIINKDFGMVFRELFGGGKASLILEDEGNVLECGIEIVVQPPRKETSKYDTFISVEKGLLQQLRFCLQCLRLILHLFVCLMRLKRLWMM
jgi:chromosome segregation protein